MLSWIYEKIIAARNLLYDRGIFESFDLGAHTISIGNITTGGTGKTPLVALVAEILAARGEKVCILTRGYGRKDAHRRVLVSDGQTILADPGESGDEPFELAQKLLGKAIVLADADRVSAAEWAKRKFGITVFVLDDGFQHRKAKRDLDIVCVDATNPFGGGKTLPTGRLREARSGLKRADIVVVTRADLSAEDISDLRSEISVHNDTATIFTSKNEITDVRPLAEFPAKTQIPQREERVAPDDLQRFDTAVIDNRALAFCGLGNPDNFFRQLQRESFSIAATELFRDHYVYTQEDITRLEKRARESNASIILTTAKDAVKLGDLKFEIPCFVVEVKVALNDANAIAAML